MKHTPTPWHAYEPSEQDLIRENAKEYAPSGPIFRIAGLPKQSRYVGLLFKSHPNEPDPTAEDAAFIVRACNCFEELLAALKTMAHDYYDTETMGVIHPTGSKRDRQRQAMQAARDAITKAEGQP